MPTDQTFIGTKVIKARKMTRGAYNEYRGWNPPEGEDQSVDGWLVEYTNGGEPNHPQHTGYISWSPDDVFRKSYRATESMSFGLAIEAMKLGTRVMRLGWNGKGMYLYYVPENRYPPTTPAGLQLVGTDGKIPYKAYIAMKTVDGEVVPWLASQTDILATDWMVLAE
jgi:hypothetical protein